MAPVNEKVRQSTRHMSSVAVKSGGGPIADAGQAQAHSNGHIRPGILYRAHQRCHISRYAASILRANRGSSINADVCIRFRKLERNSPNLGRSAASFAAVSV